MIEARQITRLRHFTTNAGITGILATGELRSRDLLAADKYLDQIYMANCDTRLDPAWTRHVSLSVTDINASFFSVCSGKWHAGMDGFWAIVEIDPAILAHDNVWFTTTNNRYTNVKRQLGVDGLEAMYSDVVYPFRPISAHPGYRRDGLAPNQPTDAQAEVLYPDFVAVEYISSILVARSEELHSVQSQVDFFARGNPRIQGVKVLVDPSAFRLRDVQASEW